MARPDFWAVTVTTKTSNQNQTMKTKFSTVILACILAVIAYIFCIAYSKAAEQPPLSSHPKVLAAQAKVAPKTPTESARWIDSITVAPVGAVRTVDLTGRSEWGAGLDLGIGVNPFVSLHLVNLAFEGLGQTVIGDGKGSSHTSGPNSWGGTLIDETDVLVKARISRFSNESVSVYGIGGGLKTWGENQRWGLSAGAGVELRFNKNFGAAVDYSVRMYSADLNGSSLDSLVRALVNISF